MSAKRGFTLIELLVVIAIITILASIVAPKIYNAMERAKMAKAIAEIKNADLALTKMLADTERKHFGYFIDWQKAGLRPETLTTPAAVAMYTAMFYELLRRGKDADLSRLPGEISLELKPEVKKKLGTSYMDLGRDPWDNQYQFYAGPMRRASMMYPFRSYRTNDNGDTYVYDSDTRDRENEKLRGSPPTDLPDGRGLVSFPCPGDLPIYIYSFGGDAENNQNLVSALPTGDPELDRQVSGYDDINNWDTQSGWSGLY